MSKENKLHIYFRQSLKYICKSPLNLCQMKKYYIYIFINLQNIYVKVFKIPARRKYITYLYKKVSAKYM